LSFDEVEPVNFCTPHFLLACASFLVACVYGGSTQTEQNQNTTSARGGVVVVSSEGAVELDVGCLSTACSSALVR
jgi:hypothetical protein